MIVPMRITPLLIAVVAVVAACVGEDPPASITPVSSDPNAKVGEYRGRCNNGQCFPGLECSKDDVCLYIDYPDGGVPPGSTTDGGGGTTDGGSVTDGATPVACPLSVIHTNDNPCPGTVGDSCSSQTALTCCLGAAKNTCKNSPPDCATEPALRCSGLGQCSGDVCCLKLADTAPAISTSECPSNVARTDVFKTDCVTKSNCQSDDYAVCRNDGECETGTCRKVHIAGPDGVVELGVCL
jgi:hypothetical protein